MINAGSAWDGWHATTALARNEKPDVDQYTGDLWAQRFPRSADCYVVSLSTLPDHDWRLLNVSGGAPYGTMFGSVHVFTYRRIGGRLLGGASCRPAPGPG